MNEQQILSHFVTNTKDSIYAVKNLPPEMFGALGSFFSRNPKDMRQHILDAVRGDIKGFEGPDRSEMLANPRTPAMALESGLQRSRKFFEVFYGKYGHKSVGNMVWIPMVGTGISQLVARELAYNQLVFFIEQSTRYVDFDSEEPFTPTAFNTGSMGEVYQWGLRQLHRLYNNIKKELTDTLTGGTDTEKPGNALMGRVYDSARYALPQATPTNLAWIADARTLEQIITRWKTHPLEEVRTTAGAIEAEASKVAPSLIKYTEGNEHWQTLHSQGGKNTNPCESGFSRCRSCDSLEQRAKNKNWTRGCELLSAPDNGLEQFIASSLTAQQPAGFQQAMQEVGEWPEQKQMAFIEDIARSIGEHDEKIACRQAGTLPVIHMEITTDVGAVRDWRRHQKNDRCEPPVSMEHGYSLPPDFDLFSDDLTYQYHHTMSLVQALHCFLSRNDSLSASQYIVPMAGWHKIRFSGGLEQILYMIYQRSTSSAHPSYHRDALNLADAVVQKYPWVLGYRHPPDGPIEHYYKKAPFRFLRLKALNIAEHQ